jgi:hypothetical protein
MFTVKEFPGQLFRSMEEYTEARRLRRDTEAELADRAQVYEDEPQKARITATVIPAAPGLLETRMAAFESMIAALESTVAELVERIHGPPEKNKEGLQIGATLRGESKGESFTLEVIEDGYLCSDGSIYDSLSGAAQGVSGNRRSGWKFWKDIHGTSIGDLTGRFDSATETSRTVS